MKNKILTIATMTAFTAVCFTTSAQVNTETENARKKEAKAQNNLRLAKIDSAADFEKFKKESELKIAENTKQIRELKSKKIIGTAKENEKYDKDVLVLEKRNNALRTKIDNCDDTKTSAWTSFKMGFSQDLDDLGCAMKNQGSCTR
jgi:hypothetical protein